MKLYGRCVACTEEIKIKSSAKTRGDLQMQMGDELHVNCHHCGKMFNMHINKIRAKVDKKLIYIGIASSILLSLIILSFSYIAVISTVIPVMIWYQEMNQVKSFNTYMIKRKYK